MIKINLLQERKSRRGSAASDKGTKSLLIGVVGLVLAGFAVFMFMHRPVAADLEDARVANKRLQDSIKKLTDETKTFDIINQEKGVAQAQEDAIQRLNDARAVPAWLLRELSNILTKDHKPTMTHDMEERIKSDHNRQWTQSWDPKRIWVDSIEEKDGRFTLKGGSQSDSDVTQLALRLQASVFFRDVVLEGGQTDTDQKSKVSFYKFTISGKVVY